MMLQDFARKELEDAGLFDRDSDYSGMIGESVMELLKTFSSQGHSGGSASIVLSLFNRLANYKPINPLTGNDDEWNDLSEDTGEPLWQNKKCPSVFKSADGRVYDINAVVYVEPDGTCFTSGSIIVSFPYTIPSKPKYIQVGFDQNPGTSIPHDLTPIDDTERERQLKMGRPE